MMLPYVVEKKVLQTQYLFLGSEKKSSNISKLNKKFRPEEDLEYIPEFYWYFQLCH